MPTRIAFIGFRHGHILDVYNAVQRRDDLALVAACEEHEPTRRQLADEGKVSFTHERALDLLDNVDCDAVAIGDYYARRGELAIAALERGRHVLLDKPICTSLSELDRIEQLARDNALTVGCQLGLCDGGAAIAARKLIADGAIGDVQTVTFLGQHPLLWGTRPAWYFEPGKHGGTINDIAIHGLDAIPWITGRSIAAVTAARAWNSTLPEAADFQVGAQLMLELDNAGGVLGDVSYFAPDKAGYDIEQYWRFTIHGSGGLLELNASRGTLSVVAHADAGPRAIEPAPGRNLGYLDDFVRQIQGQTLPATGLSTARLLASTRWALRAQAVADEMLAGADASGRS